MGTIALQTPIVNAQLATEAPKIVGDFTTIQTLVNGNLDTNNLAAAAGILPAQLAAGNARFQFVSAVANQAATDGHLYNCVGGITLTLSAVQDAVVTVFANSVVTGASPVTVSAGAGKIYGNGTGTTGATTALLGTASAHLVLYCFNGTDWLIVSGQQDSGWVSLSLATNVVAYAGSYVPSVRVVGDVVRMKGALQNATGGPIGGTSLASVPAGYRPANTNGVGAAVISSVSATAPTQLVIAASGTMILGISLPNNGQVYLDGINYSLS